MTTKKQYILSLLLLCCLGFSAFVNAQNDSLDFFCRQRFSNNLKVLEKEYCWTQATFTPGKVSFVEEVDFYSEYGKLPKSIFPEVLTEAKAFFEFLERLPENDKKNLIRYFNFYKDVFKSEIKSRNLNDELIYFPASMTAMNTRATEDKNKTGVWQLTHFQGILNGLTINSLVDERLNIELSTVAALKEIQQNTELFESSELALLAFWYGKTKIKNVLAEDKEYRNWNKLRGKLPGASQKIAAFQAMQVFLQIHTYKEMLEPFAQKSTPEKARINRQTHFKQIAKVIQVSLNELGWLNPQYHQGIVPGNEKEYILLLPSGKWDDFVLFQDSINAVYDSGFFKMTSQIIEYPPAPNRQYLGEKVQELDIEGKTKIQYRLKTGDVLGVIAEIYDVNIADLKYWNNISNERRIQAGKNIDIFVDEDKADYYKSLSEQKETKKENKQIVEQLKSNATQGIYKIPESAKKIEHVVKSGDSPYTIAKLYEGVSPDEILEWNNITDTRKIQIGQKLIIYLKNETR